MIDLSVNRWLKQRLIVCRGFCLKNGALMYNSDGCEAVKSRNDLLATTAPMRAVCVKLEFGVDDMKMSVLEIMS
jgi:hypothetical protein